MADNAQRDQNRVTGILLKGNDGTGPWSWWVDPSTHRALVNATLNGNAIPASGLATATAVQIVDGSGNQITSFGGGTQYTDGGTPPVSPIAPTLVFDKSNAWQHVNLTNGLPVNIVAGGGTGGGPADVGTTTAASETDAARQKVTSALRLLDTAQGAGSQLVAAKGDQTSGLWVNVKASAAIVLGAGTAVIGHVITDSGSTTAVTGTVTISGAVTEASLDGALIAQEATTASIKGLTAFGAVTTAKPTYVTGKSDALSMDVNGLLRVSLADTPANGAKLLVTADAITFASPQHVITDATSVTAATLSAETTKVIGTINVAASQTIAVTNAGTFAVQATLAAETTKVIGTVNQGTSPWVASATLQTQTDTTMIGGVNVKEINAVTPLMGNGTTGTGSQRVTLSSDNTAIANWGQGATGAAVPAGAQYNGILAKTALPTAATDGNLTGMMSDKFGRPVVLTNSIRDLTGSQTTTISASTSETTIITAGGAGIFNDLVAIFISNTSASAARVDIRDATSGSVIFQIYIPAGDIRGISLATPWPQTTAANNWTAQSSASVTDLRVSAQYVKNK